MSNDTPYLKQLNLFDTPAADTNASGVVYFVHSPATELTKIGSAGNLKRRRSQYVTHNPEKLEWLFTVQTSEYKQLEKQLHAQFAGKRRQGEWFELSQSDFIWVYKNIPACHGLDNSFKAWILEVYMQSKERRQSTALSVLPQSFVDEFKKRRLDLSDPFDDYAVWNLYTSMLLGGCIEPAKLFD